MVGTPDETHDMRNNYPNETDSSHKADCGRSYQGGRSQQDHFRALDINTQLLCLLLIQLHDIQRPGKNKNNYQSNGDIWGYQPELVPAAIGKIAHEPVRDTLH